MDKSAKDLVLISVNNTTKLGIYSKDSLESAICLNGMVSHTLPFLFEYIFSDKGNIAMPNTITTKHSMTHISDSLESISHINSICYARGVGSLSAIKLTHIFLHTLCKSKKIPLFAKNSFYFTTGNEIKAFANKSFFLQSRDMAISDDMADKYILIAQSINPAESLELPAILKHGDFDETCTPLYVTPPL